jgi:6,7-dimethyl-8-ribityllumazine synthase
VIAVSRFNEEVTQRLLEGALRTLGQAGWPRDSVDVLWVPGAFELPLAVDQALATGRYRLAVALGAVIRGETAHFEYIAGAATTGLEAAARARGIPLGFGVLTCDTEEQALERAGGANGNKGEEAAQAALAMRRILDELEDGASA